MRCSLCQFTLCTLLVLTQALAVGGCTKPKETTAIGTATGGALGAGLGAIIGNQTGDAGSGLAIGAVAGAATGALIGNALQAQQESVRSQDEAIERQERMLAAQRREIVELRNLNPDVVEQKRLALQKRGPSPSSAEGIRTISSNKPKPLSHSTSDPLARLDLRSKPIGERPITVPKASAASLRPGEQPRGSAATPAKSEKLAGNTATAKHSSTSESPSDACVEAEKERSLAANAMDSSDKLFHLRRALRLCPQNAPIHHELGKVYAAMDRSSDAEQEFKQALELDPAYEAAQESLDRITSNSIKF
jgi:tetratricopeptide (TPR) repeat protein